LDIKTKILVNKFKNISYFKDLEDYISDRVNENKLDYDKLKYLYDNLYKGRSEFIKQNIYPVGEFLSSGYSFEECEKITDLLEDATGKTIFFYEKKEQGHRFNKLFVDLKFSFDKYNEFIKCGNSKDIAFEKLKFELDNTPLKLREIIVTLSSNKYIYHSEMESYCKYINDEMEKLRNDFREDTSKDEKLLKHFENDNPKNRFQSIRVAGTILAGIDLRNLQRENNNLTGAKEEYPYNDKQLKMIDLFNRLENTMEKAEQYIELNYDQENNIEM